MVARAVRWHACAVSTEEPEHKGDRSTGSVWGHRLTSACVAAASGMAVSQLSNTLGYKGPVGASVMAGIVAGVFWLRRLPARAPLLRYSVLVLLISAFAIAGAAFIIPSAWTAYFVFTSIGLTIVAACLTVDFLVSCAVLGGAGTVGAGIAIISDGLILTPHGIDGPVLEPLVKSPEPILIMAAGVLITIGGVALIAVRETMYVAPLMRVGIVIAIAGLAAVLAGRSSSAETTLVPAGLAIGGFGTATVGVAGLLAWIDTKTPKRATVVCAVCGVAIIAFDLGARSGWETMLGHVSTLALGGSAVCIGIALHYEFGRLGYSALALAAVSIIGLGITILTYPHSLAGKASIGTSIAITALGATGLWFPGTIGVMFLFDKNGRMSKMLRSLTSSPSGSLSVILVDICVTPSPLAQY
jgi:hypothetical protein